MLATAASPQQQLALAGQGMVQVQHEQHFIKI
jgi:hypothetical protein